MKRLSRAVLLILALLFTTAPEVQAARLLIPGGQLIGLELSNEVLTVAAFDENYGAYAREAGLEIGDQILSLDGKRVSSAEEVRQSLKSCGLRVTLGILRGSKRMDISLSPATTRDGKRLGVYLRQGIAGVGTVTFYDPESDVFGTLGHGVNDSQGKLMHMKSGRACKGAVASVKKGKCGDPGQLRGNADPENSFGILTRNTPQGVFGTSRQGITGEPLPIAAFSEIVTGPATIRSTVGNDGVREYSVEILKIYPEDRADGRNLLIRITDPQLLQTTGGIVQGMSGSPIIQNGKLVGAVTHVLVNDPTRGYGIFIENMLDAAG